MGNITRGLRDAYERSEGWLGRSWPVWVLAIILYAIFGQALLTRVRVPSSLHLVVYIMAAGTLVVTLIDTDAALVGLAAMIPFARPGFSLGEMKAFHVSGFNVAVVGVWLVYIFRYMTDPDLAAKGPLFRRIPQLDWIFVAFLSLATIAAGNGINLNVGIPEYQVRILTFLKDWVLFILWFYLIVTLLRKPEDVRRFAVFFALSGILVAAFGLYGRITGAIEQVSPYITEAELESGVAGGRTRGVGAGGWFGLGHANLFAAFLLMTLPFWFFGADHLRRAFHRVTGYLLVLFGFVALLYTYARSGWTGMTVGLTMLGLREPKVLGKLLMFIVAFAVVAQIMTVALVGVGVVDIVQMRFEQLERSQFSGRPLIFASAFRMIQSHPLVGVGPSSFRLHAQDAGLRYRFLHAHNVALTYACELGVPAAIAYVMILIVILRMAWQNLRLRGIPGYGFVAQGGYVAFFAITTLSMFDHIFFDRGVGFAFFALAGIVVALNRMLREGMLPGLVAEGSEASSAAQSMRPSKLWIGS